MPETRYTYPDPPPGYTFTMLTRIENEVGVAPDGSYTTGGNIVIIFADQLTAPQTAILDALMTTGDPRNPPTPTGTVILIDDVWENRQRDWGGLLS
jgi:hypothetical protein